MKRVITILMGAALALSLAACQSNAAPSAPTATIVDLPVETATPAPAISPAPSRTPFIPTPEVAPASVPAVSALQDTTDIAALEAFLGYPLRQPAALPEGYVLERGFLNEATCSVCLQYRFPHHTYDNILWLAQGPVEAAPPLAQITGWPDYAFLYTPVQIGGAENGQRIAGWRRSAWACTAAAEAYTPQYSFALSPQLTWQMEGRQFDLYAANAGCATPGGLTALDLLRLAESLTGSSTHAVDELDPDCLHSPTEAEKLAGFHVQSPAYLPEYASFYFATYEKTPEPLVTLRFFHKEHADMGAFFRITQQADKPPFFSTACEESSQNVCEILQIGALSVIYHSSNGGTEQLDWYADGFYFSLFRNAGEPGKSYKDELVKIVASMQ